ncbi:c-type cytochrome [Polaribacter sp. P097]|uniref:c-type cytochrome n=1 Tax=Polaribacter sp. P097 TaxID=3117398 RepID=UPI002FE308F1
MTNKSKIKTSYLIVVLLITVVLYYNYSFEKKTAYCATPVAIDYTGKSLTDKYKEGRKLYKMLCASCHKLDKKLIGPALANEDLTFDYFYQYSINEKNLLDSLNIQALEINKSHIDFSYEHSFNQLKKENVKMIYDYVNMAYLD